MASSPFQEPELGGGLQATTSPPPRSNQAHHHDLIHANQRKLLSFGVLRGLAGSCSPWSSPCLLSEWSWGWILVCIHLCAMGFPGGSDGKEPACNARNLGSIPGSGRSHGEESGYSLQYSCLENSMDRERSLVGYSP